MGKLCLFFWDERYKVDYFFSVKCSSINCYFAVFSMDLNYYRDTLKNQSSSYSFLKNCIEQRKSFFISNRRLIFPEFQIIYHSVTSVIHIKPFIKKLI